MYMLLGSYGDDMRDDMWVPRRAGTNRRGVYHAQRPPHMKGGAKLERKTLRREKESPELGFHGY
jgi:hypothetical protein